MEDPPQAGCLRRRLPHRRASIGGGWPQRTAEEEQLARRTGRDEMASEGAAPGCARARCRRGQTVAALTGCRNWRSAKRGEVHGKADSRVQRWRAELGSRDGRSRARSHNSERRPTGGVVGSQTAPRRRGRDRHTNVPRRRNGGLVARPSLPRHRARPPEGLKGPRARRQKTIRENAAVACSPLTSNALTSIHVQWPIRILPSSQAMVYLVPR